MRHSMCGNIPVLHQNLDPASRLVLIAGPNQIFNIMPKLILHGACLSLEFYDERSHIQGAEKK